MNISKQYVDMLRYVSANGEKSILEIPRPIIKKHTQLKYLGTVEYKTIPNGMPQKINAITYKKFEELMQQCNQTKSSILDAWFNLLTPKEKILTGIEKEVKACYDKKNIDKIEFFKTLSEEEKNCISRSVPDHQFIATLSGHKPAWFCEHGFNGNIDFSKIKLNPNISDKFDVIELPDKAQGLYFLNKQEVFNIIENNKDLYCAHLGLNSSAKTEKIYKSLLKALKEGSVAVCKKGEALFGITLGFPRHSSMIFEMERELKKHNSDLRKNIPLFKEKLIELLHSDACPFKHYPKSILDKLENHIKLMNNVRNGTNVCQCIVFGDEKTTLNSLQKKQQSFDKNFKVEDLIKTC